MLEVIIWTVVSATQTRSVQILSLKRTNQFLEEPVAVMTFLPTLLLNCCDPEQGQPRLLPPLLHAIIWIVIIGKPSPNT